MANVGDNGSGKPLGTAFSQQVRTFLDGNKMSPYRAAKEIGVKEPRLKHYARPLETEEEARPEPGLGLFCALSSKLGFVFEYGGVRFRAEKLDGTPVPPVPQQQEFEFNKKFKLERNEGDISVSVHRPPGRIKVSLSLKSNAS